MYFFIGLGYLIQGILPATIVYLLILGGLSLLGKRTLTFYKQNKFQILTEYLLVVYLFAILNITGVIFKPYHLEWAKNGISGLKLPFVGSSLKMVLLNTILFIPYGFLVSLCFRIKDWRKIAFIAFGTTLCIESLQLFTGRMFESDDLIANMIGTFVGYFFYRGLLDCCSKRRQKIISRKK